MTGQNDNKKKLKQRNLAVAGVLFFMALMFFAVSLLKVQESLNVPG